MKIEVINQAGEKVQDYELNPAFEKQVSDKAVSLYVNYLLSAMRDPIANTKDRSEVSGTGKKPYKQKGTGRARQGSYRSPLFVGGGVTFGPTNERNFKVRINKKTKKSVILGIIGRMIADNKMVAIDSLALSEIKTKKAIEVLGNAKVEGKITVIYNEEDRNADLSFRNISGVKPLYIEKLNLIKILSSDHLLVSLGALKKIEEVYC